jgi:hypothetical protein
MIGMKKEIGRTKGTCCSICGSSRLKRETVKRSWTNSDGETVEYDSDVVVEEDTNVLSLISITTRDDDGHYLNSTVICHDCLAEFDELKDLIKTMDKIGATEIKIDR